MDEHADVPADELTALLAEIQGESEALEHETVIALCTRLLKRQPHPHAFYYRGISRYSLAETAVASADLRQAVQLDPSNADAWFWLGMAIYEQGLERNIAAPPHPGWMLAVGGCQYVPAVVAEAIATVTHALACDDRRDYRYQRALMHETAAAWEAADADHALLVVQTEERFSYREAALLGRARCAFGRGDDAAGRQYLATYNGHQVHAYRQVDPRELLDLFATWRAQQGPAATEPPSAPEAPA